MFQGAMWVFSIWTSMSSWLTPTVLFLLLNLMIGTIVVTSNFTSQKYGPSNEQQEQQQKQQQESDRIQTQITRSPSVLQRLRSLNFYSYNHSHTPCYQPTTIQQPPLEPVISTTGSGNSTSSVPVVLEVQPDEDGPTMEEVYSRILQQQQQQQNKKPHYSSSSSLNSDTKPAGVGGEMPMPMPIRLPAKLNKPAGGGAYQAQETPAKPTEVDAKADDFINRFRAQLNLQRLQSILRYNHMITTPASS